MRPKLALAMCFMFAAAMTTLPAQGRDLSAGPSVRPHEFSAATTKKKKRKVVVAAPAPRAFGWRGADPSFDQNGRPYQPPAYLGGCVLDLGYGRFKSCNINE